MRRHERAGAKDLLWGGAIDLFFIRLGYNTVFDYENMFHASGTFIAEVKVNLGSIGGRFFGRGAAQAAPMETTDRRIDLKKSLKALSEQHNLGSTKVDAQGNKVIEAKGIRYEKTGSSGTTSNEGGY